MKRLIYGLILGAILGVFCIIGAQARTIDSLSSWYLFGFWFNRLLMGAFIGVLPSNNDWLKIIIRGLIVGIFVSFAFFSATNYFDVVGFLVGGVYGIIIEVSLKRLARN